MQPNQPPKDEGQTVLQRLAPDQFDVVLGSHPTKRKSHIPKAAGRSAAWLSVSHWL